MTSSANNSTNIPLTGGASWVGLYESPVDTIQGVQILINSNVSGTAYIQFSQDKTRVEYEHAYGVIGGIPLYKIERRKAKFIRMKYVNDASAQTLMLLHTTYLTDYEREDMPVIIDAEDSNILQFAETPSGQLSSVKCDPSGNLFIKHTPVERINLQLLDEDTLNADVGSPVYDVSDFKKCVLSYTDTDSSSSASLSLYAGDSIEDPLSYIGEILPIVNSHTLTRYASVNLDLSPFTVLQIVNYNVVSVGGIIAKLFGSI